MSRLDPMAVVHVDLADGLPVDPFGVDDERIRFVVLWWRELPLGQLQVTPQQLRAPASLAAQVARAIAPAVGDRVLDGLDAAPPGLRDPPGPGPVEVSALPRLLPRLDQVLSGRPQPSPAPPVSVIVCTRDRPEGLARLLASLEVSTLLPEQVVVVDNAGRATAQEVVAAHAGGALHIDYLHEPRPGLSIARNAGLRVATGDIIAFTDDDVEVHPDWVWRLREVFTDPAVDVATGLVLPARLDTRAQVAFELAGGFNLGFQRRTFAPGFLRAMQTVSAPVWKIGAGANMALRRDIMIRLGGFDERLGAGAAGCSEDSEMWYRVLAAGGTCRYDPAAVVLHHHREDQTALAAQAEAYMRGHVAALFVQFARHRHLGNLRRIARALPRHFRRRAFEEAVRPPEDRTGLLRAEFTGYLRGLRYIQLALPSRRVESRRHLPRLRSFLRRNPYPHPFTEGLYFREKMRAIHRVTPDEPVHKALEVGGGQSGLTSLLFPAARTVTVDLEPVYGQSSANDPSSFLAADATRLPFPDGCFDAVTMFDVLEHIPDDVSAAAEAMRVLRSGGLLLITSPNERWRFPYHRALAPICPTDQEVMAEWGHVRRGYHLDDLRRVVGSEPLATHPFINPLTVWMHDVGFSRLRRRYRRLASFALMPLAWTGYVLQAPRGAGTETASSWRRPYD